MMYSKYSRRAVSLLSFLPLLLPVVLTGQTAQVVPPTNWAAPLYWQPNQAEMAERAKAEAAGGVTPRIEFSASQVSPSALTFIAITPCRLVDTRGVAAGFNGLTPFSGPSLAPSTSVAFPVQSAAEATADTTPTPCGAIPSIAQAYSFNITVVPKTAGGVAFVTVWPSGSAQPAVSTINDGQGQILANAAIVPAGTPSGGVSVFNSGPATTDVIIDMNGFYAAPTDLSQNTAIGAGAMANATGGYSDTAVGYEAMQNTIGGSDTATGFEAMQANTGGAENTADGAQALQFNTTGSNNTAVGNGAMLVNSTGNSNTATGSGALFGNSLGNNNTAVGFHALLTNQGGSDNTAVGYGALLNNSGSSNTAIGLNALASNSSGSSNIAIGLSAASVVAGTNSNNIHIGSLGSSVDSGVIRIGTQGAQTSFFAAGVTSANLSSDTSAVPVVVDSTTGQLGVGNFSAGGGIAGVAAGTDLTGGGTNGMVTLNVDTTKIPTLAGTNTFTGPGNFFTGGNVGIGTATPASTLDVNGNINFSGSVLYQGLPILGVPGIVSGANYNLSVGTFALASSLSGNNNTAVGTYSLPQDFTGDDNTAVGAQTLFSNKNGSLNTAVGYNTLGNNINAVGNTAVGAFAILNNADGSNNTAVGQMAEASNQGSNNTAAGFQALYFNIGGSSNVAVGYQAGYNIGGSNNIDIGSQGSANDNGAIRIGGNTALGDPVAQTSFFVAGVANANLGSDTNAVGVLIDTTTGQLGVASSSRRYKEDIEDMGEASRDLMRLRPVTFRYKKPSADGSKPVQYGLIAEEVNEVYPDLVAHSSDGRIETVKYQVLDSMLLNEVQRQQAEIAAQKEQLQKLEQRLNAQTQQNASLLERLNKLEAVLGATSRASGVAAIR